MAHSKSGETVRGYMPSSFNIRNVSETSIPNISFRVAVSNHKYGPYNNASTVYDSSPYNKDLNIPPSYSETSSTLNVDTFSLQDEKEPEYSGYIAQTMILVGQSSGAQATVTKCQTCI